MAQQSAKEIYLVGARHHWAPYRSALDAHYGCVRRFGDAARLTAWLDYSRLPPSACVVMPLRHAPLSGIDVLDILRADLVLLPVVLLANADELLDAVRTTRYDGVYTVWRPLRTGRLLTTIDRALADWDVASDVTTIAAISVDERIESLSLRQRQVLHCVFAGNANRTIADELGISVKTVELHRACMMKKMQADSVIHLIRMLADYGRTLQSA